MVENRKKIVALVLQSVGVCVGAMLQKKWENISKKKREGLKISNHK